jgi:hypothetical protein
MFDLRKLPFVCANVPPLVFRKKTIGWDEIIPDFETRKSCLARLDGIGTFPSPGDIGCDLETVEVTGQEITFAHPGAYNIVCNFGVFKILILSETKSASDIISIGRFYSANVIHSGHDVSNCSYQEFISSVLFYNNIFYKLFHSDQPIGLMCCSASLGLCALYSALGFEARRVHFSCEGRGHYSLEAFDGERWCIVDPDFDFVVRNSEGALLDAQTLVNHFSGADLSEVNFESLSEKQESARFAELSISDEPHCSNIPEGVKNLRLLYGFSGGITWYSGHAIQLRSSDLAPAYLRLMCDVRPLGHSVSRGIIASEGWSTAHINLEGINRQSGEASESKWQIKFDIAAPFRQQGEFCWHADLPSGVVAVTDTDDAPNQSNLCLLENNQSLGPPHSVHAAIGSEGGGRFSFWRGQLYFSTSDGSNPNTNGRSYAGALLKL